MRLSFRSGRLLIGGEEDAESDEDEQAEKERGGGSGKRKRSVLEDIYQGLTKKPMTFS